MRKPTNTIALQVRMPEPLRRKLAKEAEANGRSMNSEIVWRLGQSCDAPDLAQAQDEFDAQTKKKIEEIVRDMIAKGKAGR